jgi:molybdenum cofactor cytidylyltransferase
MVPVISAIILAAGESKRMGKPKQLMPLGGSTILEQTIDNLLNSEVNEVIVVIGNRAEEMNKLIANMPVRVALNPAYHEGMSTSIIAGLNLIDNRAQAIMLALADQPFIDSQTINRLIDEFSTNNKGIAIPVYHGKRGHPVIFAIKYKEQLLRLKGDIGGRQIVKGYPDDILEVAVDSENIITDVDTINDYQSYIS